MKNSEPIQILMAEDQETDAFFVEQAFAQSKIENVVHWVRDGQEVMDFLSGEGKYEQQPRPHLIILDIKMPRKDGMETLEEIKGDERLKDIPVLIMSGSQAPDDVLKAYKKHANAYVAKTNGFDDMLSFVEAVEKFWFMRARLPQAQV
ncbi:MAG: response regulator [Rhodospirillales bacterium]|nr:response regulator [Rhodospirillales bacterium]